MFYKLIKKTCDQWIHSSDCTIHELMQYIYTQNKMRDAQIEAIQIYLFLKIACKNRPLWQLFMEGRFNSLDLSTLELTVEARHLLTSNKAAAALLEYALLKDKTGNQLAPELEKVIKTQSERIDYEETFRKIFYGVNYTDYLFSLPMGSGKTYLMAAFIYLDLYFALNEPSNPVFAHNFMILAPSGLKSSILPSLKTIQEFDPTWIIPDPAASTLKKMIQFEILDEQKSAQKSNLVRNPNAQKINNHQPLEDLMGLVTVTNAEKVILNRMDKNEDLFDKDGWKETLVANELRNIIGKIPHLAVFIDEVHHAADGEIKLRQVVEEWTKKHTFCGVLGFSGTPYLEKAEKVTLADSFQIKNTDLSNVVYYYPLLKGVGNFLKIPEVKYADNDTETIIDNGVREFLDKFAHLVYPNGTAAKLAIYCSKIETLEEVIYPLVARIASEYGLNPTETILKYHGGNKVHPQPEGSEMEFASLDTDLSKIRLILLVQIGKEGWDCKSLTGVILPQKGACPTNMVLQTSCRCLRQTTRNAEEYALIWLNKFNADTLNKQLKQQQNISLQELNQNRPPKLIPIERYSRMEKLQVPPIDFYQLKVSYQTLITEAHPHTEEKLTDETLLTQSEAAATVIHLQDMAGNELEHYLAETDTGEYISFRQWLYLIAKESFHTLGVENLNAYKKPLEKIFMRITLPDGTGNRRYDNRYNQTQIRSLIRRAFVAKRTFSVKEEVVPCEATLLQIERLLSPVFATDEKLFYPSQKVVKAIRDWDVNAPNKILSPEELALLEKMKQRGYEMPEPNDPHPEREQTYHYLPYRFDSRLEREYFKDSVLPILKSHSTPLEIYFNGDDNLTDFKIDCYQQMGKEWKYIGKYVPDFLLLSRKEDGTIHRIVLIETKGEGFAAQFANRRQFMETEFIRKNNERFGYERFRFLYLEDTLSKEERETKTLQTIQDFFNI